MEFDSHLALVRAGLGIALVPAAGPLRRWATTWSPCAPTDPVPTREVIAVHRRSMTASPAVAAVLAALAGA